MKKGKIKLKIVTPEKTVFEGGAGQVTLPVLDGEVTILPNHRSYIAALQSGEIILKDNGEENILAVSGGFVEFNKNKLVVLADAAERAEEIDIKKAEEARERAEDLKKEIILTDESDYARVISELERSTAWIKIAKKYSRRKGL